MHKFSCHALLAVALAMLVSARPTAIRGVSTDGFEAERAAAAKELISGLEGYAEWCSTKKIWVERNHALESILAIDPGNLSAKRGLGWQQVADGVWEPPKEPKPTKNYDLAALKDAPARYTEAIRPWREHLVALLETHKADVTPLQRDAIYSELIAVDPNDDFARAARGEEHTDKGWVLAETVRAKARRSSIKEIVKRALEAAPGPVDFVPNAGDMQFGIDWKTSISTDRVRVLSTGNRPEALRVAQVLHAAREVFQGVFSTQTDLGRDFTIFLVCSPEARKTFIGKLPGVSDAQRSFYEHVDGTGLQGSTGGAWWSSTPERRLDGVTRHTLGAMFQSEFNLTVDQAWAWEGLGLYLTREMIGTRLTWYIVPVPENQSGAVKRVGPDWMKKLLTPGTNWMNEGYRLLRAGDVASLAATLQRPMNKMSPQDLFVSYVTCAYLLEAQAPRLPGLLHAIGGSKERPGAKLLETWPASLSMDMETFTPRLERWLGERR